MGRKKKETAETTNTVSATVGIAPVVENDTFCELAVKVGKLEEEVNRLSKRHNYSSGYLISKLG